MELIKRKIFITGGAGFLGKNLIKELYDQNNITIYSRDEAKHYFLKKQYPKINCIVGDVRNYELLRRSSKNHDIGIFAASLKQIEACDENYEEANQIIVQGSFNSKNSAIENDFIAACFISTDKSRAASTIYGSLKHTAGESFISNNKKVNCNFTTAIYGNILNSTGSIIPVIWEYIKNKKTLHLFGEDMTRFMLTVNDAIGLILKSLDYKNVNTIPEAKSFRLKDLFEIYTEFGLTYQTTLPRPNEKIHEIMIASEELPRIEHIVDKKMYLMHHLPTNKNIKFSNNEYSSKDFLVSKEELYNILSLHNFFKT